MTTKCPTCKCEMQLDANGAARTFGPGKDMLPPCDECRAKWEAACKVRLMKREGL